MAVSPSLSPSLSPSKSPSLSPSPSYSPSKSPSRSPSLSPSVSPSPSAATAEASMMKEYGYRITGDTGTVNVTTQRIKIKTFIFVPATAASDTAVITDNANNTIMTIMSDIGVDGEPSQIDWSQSITGLKVRLNNASAVLIVIVE